MLGMCYNLCTSSSVTGGWASRIFFFASGNMSIVGWFFGTWFFADGFLFPVKELGLLTNPSHWVRVLDVIGSYMYIVF
jgi:hypothetical protein